MLLKLQGSSREIEAAIVKRSARFWNRSIATGASHAKTNDALRNRHELFLHFWNAFGFERLRLRTPLASY